ncbi:hypothetical protein M514_00632 [Trichuris suis]|uniref:HTH CENPB-type domain-containing protein n=2 Tax=Trichuris suis TaxID=68888 RepID=A0A085N732_9BILA|nr:hypothetical protein M513_00632 [Trichuris suis]KFD65278.1 hypothetical protein M514_00632 [Trichuris suis]
MPFRGRKCYNAAFKLKVIAAAQATNNCAAARQFNVDEKNVRDWRKSEETLRRMPRRKCALRGGAPAWPQLEVAVAEWVVTQRQTGHPVTRNKIKRQALEWATRNPRLCHGFTATSSWCSRFMERMGLVEKNEEEEPSTEADPSHQGPSTSWRTP